MIPGFSWALTDLERIGAHGLSWIVLLLVVGFVALAWGCWRRLKHLRRRVNLLETRLTADTQYLTETLDEVRGAIIKVIAAAQGAPVARFNPKADLTQIGEQREHTRMLLQQALELVERRKEPRR